MALDDIINSVILAVDDNSFEYGDIADLITIGRGEIAGEIDLPSLLTVDTVASTAGANIVALPLAYSRNLFWVGNYSGRIGKPGRGYYDLMGFLDRNQVDRVGAICDVCVQGNNLLYQGAADDTLTLRFYSAPTGNEPDEIPSHLQKALLHNYACKEIFNIIEDGMEGAKVNTRKYESSFAVAMSKLSIWADKQRPREPKIMAETRCDIPSRLFW